MSAGTLTLTNNSTSIYGTGTAFNTELAAGDFIVVTVGGVPYTLPIKSVESATSLTLVSVYTGPTQSGAAWSAVPRVALNMVTAALVAQSAEALRGLNYDKQNWQQVFSGTGNVTVKLPDGSAFTGPAWRSIANDPRFDTVNGKTGGYLTSSLSVRKVQAAFGVGMPIGTSIGYAATGSAHTEFVMVPEVATNGDRYGHVYLGQDGTNKDWFFNFSSGTAWSPGGWQNSSDIRIKDEIERIQDPLGKMKMLRGCSWVRKDDGMKGAFGLGFIAQEVQEAFPHAVLKGLTGTITVDGKTIEDPLSIEPGAIAAALHHEAILALMEQVEKLTSQIQQFKKTAESGS